VTQGWPPPSDPGYRVDGALPAGFDVAGFLAQLYPGQRLTRGMEIPVGGAKVTITADTFDVPGPGAAALSPPAAYGGAAALSPPPAYGAAGPLQPPPASPGAMASPAGAGAPLTPPPGMTDPIQIAMWLKGLKASGQIPPGTVVQLSSGGGSGQPFVLGGAAGPDGQVDKRALLASLLAGGGAAGQAGGMFVSTSMTVNGMPVGSSGGGDIHRLLDRILTTMDAGSLQRAGGLGRRLSTQGSSGEAIRAHDPAFTETGLIAEATAAFWALTAARAENRPEAVQRHLSAPMYEREARQMQINGQQGRRHLVESLEVRAATIDECGAGLFGDHATIRFRLWGADRDVDHNGKRIAGDKKPTDWHELWTLARSPGSTTPGPGSPAAACARCGFAGADSAADVCPGCGHPLPAAPGRWLVAGIIRVEPRKS
jgi:hypothetical protein